MPDRRLALTRATLPADYQFGDAGRDVMREAMRGLAAALSPRGTLYGIVVEPKRYFDEAQGWRLNE